jgi:hypothetical protein
MSPVTIAVGDGVTLRKAHPCGGFEWTVVRTGADIGIKCDKCGRRVMLDRDEFERRARQVGPVTESASGPASRPALPSSGDTI